MSAIKGTTVKDVPADKFIAAYAALLKRSGKLPVPAWNDIVKLGKFNELSPYDADWFYVRVAAVARRIYIRGGFGTRTLTKIYGTTKSSGSTPNHFVRGSGSVARAALKALEAVKVVKQGANGGRILTKTGRRDLDRIAGQITL